MSLEEKLKSDFEVAFKSRNVIVADTLRLLVSALHNRAIEKRGKGEGEKLSDEETLEITRREVKKRKEAIALYTQGKREDLAEKERAECNVLEIYLPAQMDEDTIKKEVQKIVSAAGEVNAKDFGKVMGIVMKELKGKADAAVVTRILKEFLS
ncbi:MAG: GatB/YqeY domain-containing protein [Candidatus Paceibacterota bacterium]|jgi:hypothetical protein